MKILTNILLLLIIICPVSVFETKRYTLTMHVRSCNGSSTTGAQIHCATALNASLERCTQSGIRREDSLELCRVPAHHVEEIAIMQHGLCSTVRVEHGLCSTVHVEDSHRAELRVEYVVQHLSRSRFVLCAFGVSVDSSAAHDRMDTSGSTVVPTQVLQYRLEFVDSGVAETV